MGAHYMGLPFVFVFITAKKKKCSQTIPERLLQFQGSHRRLIELMNAMR